ncbi:CBS domain-containing protein [Archangium lipolyticum]|uniref:CBS domain-containing protein n=1 Tax=Archangium lipolyticum TaxID=2970465 RepID=UPI0027D44E9D|nr:CBS domain-containing protein [Archangium lipolyticum]
MPSGATNVFKIPCTHMSGRVVAKLLPVFKPGGSLMRQDPTLAERMSSTEVTLLPTDTLLRALRVMERHGVSLLPVVEEAGGLVGLISRAHVLSAWRVDPLLPVGLVMSECGKPREGPWEGPSPY